MKKILIIRLSSLGDIVLTQSAAQALRDEFPNAEIHYITKRIFAPIVDMFNCVDEIHYWENKFTLLQNLKKLKFDIVIDLHSKLNTYIIKDTIRAKQTVTYNKKHLLRRQIVKRRTNKVISSTVDLYFTALKKIGINSQIKEPRLFPKSNIKLPDIIIEGDDKKNIGLFPGALHKTKQYPVKQLAEFITSVPSRWECRFYLFGSKEERQLAKELSSKTDKETIDLCGVLDLKQLVNAVDSMDFVISNDSGPMHIAAAMGKKQVAIFGATHPKLGFAPMNKNAVILSADLQCQPCSLHGGNNCPLEHFNCMRSISSKQIITSLQNYFK